MKPDDGHDIPWLGPFDSGEQVMKDHTFSEKGTYEISLQAKDTYGNIGPVTTITFTYGKTIDHQFPLLEWILQRFPLMYALFERIVSF
jgi:hypothetical protein